MKIKILFGLLAVLVLTSGLVLAANATNQTTTNQTINTSLLSRSVVSTYENIFLSNKLQDGVGVDFQQHCTTKSYVAKRPVVKDFLVDVYNGTNRTNSTETVQRTIYQPFRVTEEVCETDKVLLERKFLIDTDNYECSIARSGDVKELICDSIWDGNGDGICSDGETCLKYVVRDGSLIKLEKNSASTFSDGDPTFFLSRARVEVLQ